MNPFEEFIRFGPPPEALDRDAVERTLSAARVRLLESRARAGHWEGYLSPSALATATATCALETVRRNRNDPSGELEGMVRKGLAWLASHANPDGGFGDTPECPSNLSTTTLVWAALGLAKGIAGADRVVARAEEWIQKAAGGLSPQSLGPAIAKRYGNDRTFSVPILTMCAIAGRFGEGRDAWKSVPGLPFELAALPRSWFPRIGLPVVSYALPALIAIGQVRHHRRPTWNPFALLLRAATKGRTLRILEAIQPSSGGFLEATPLTSFVTMSLASGGLPDHPVTRKGVSFLVGSVRGDGSWAIDSNLSTWVTTLSIQALSTGGPLDRLFLKEERATVRAWLLAQQMKTVHPYTGAAPGGWAWTDLSGGVPDADDTPGALLALAALKEGDDPGLRSAAEAGVSWLLDLQNKDGGVPTFCRGWGKLPFDRSCPDLTAHALRAWHVWRPEVSPEVQRRIDGASARAQAYLVRAQREDGTWIPLWFGNPRGHDDENPVYGTARVMLCSTLPAIDDGWTRAHGRAAAWLLSAQNPDRGFGGAPGLPSTIEETALAVEALATFPAARSVASIPLAVEWGCRWLADRTQQGNRFDPSPIGLYFARLWYWERLYPLIFTVGALERGLGLVPRVDPPLHEHEHGEDD
jgi:squalene-hopene/tetraprenyl-beta-curcumene cyclase